MARIRSVKPELRTDLTVAEWPREVRYAWVLLLGYLDDYGRGRDDTRLVVADLFPLDRDVTERKIDQWLDRMAKSGPLCRYTVDGQGYMHAVKWGSHQRISHPTDSRLPPCPIHDLHEPLPNDSGTVPEPSTNGSGAETESLRASRARAEQGTGSREQGTGIAPDKPSRKRDELFDALAEVCGVDVPGLTKSGLGSFTGALKQLREVEATPNQVKVRARRYRATFPNMSLTPPALAKHWASLTDTGADDVDDASWARGGR